MNPTLDYEKTVFESITWMAFGEYLKYVKPQKWYRYSLPRQCGATKFLIRTANRLHNEGKRVLFMTYKHEAIQSCQNRYDWPLNREIPTYSSASNELIAKQFRQQKYDWIIADNVGLLTKPSPYLIGLMEECADHILWIDTHEGQPRFEFE